MASNLLDGVYLFNGLVPDPDQVVENFNSASDEDKKRFFIDIGRELWDQDSKYFFQ